MAHNHAMMKGMSAMAEPLLLTYNLNSLTAEGVKALCRRQGIRFREVAPAEYALPIGALAGIPVAAGGMPSADAFDEPMLVMCHMLSDQLDAFLAGLRESGLPRIPLKAVLTPTNVAWNSVALHEELAREHAALRARPGKP